jgi:predicted kinase
MATKPKLYLFIGYPGSGKTTVAQLVEKATSAVHLWADQERHNLFGKPSHSASESTQLYDELNARTDKLLAEGYSVLFDTNFNYYSDREKLRSIAKNRGATPVLIWVNTSRKLSRDRAIGTAAPVRNGYPMHMSPQAFDVIADKLEEPTLSEQPICIDGTHVVPAEVLKKLGIS